LVNKSNTLFNFNLEEALIKALNNNKFNSVEVLADKLVSSIDFLKKVDPLNLSIEKNNFDFVNLILSKFSCYKTSNSLEKYMNESVRLNNYDVVELLLNFITDCKGTEYLKEKLLISDAVSNNNIDLVKLLLKNPNYKNSEDFNQKVLHTAMKKGNLEMIDYLLAEGVASNFKDQSRKKPIDYCPENLKPYLISKYGLF
jgi:ankyrin repeat protein